MFADDAVFGQVQTTDATVTTLALYTPPDGGVATVRVVVSARRSTGAEAAGYERVATVRRAGGTTTLVGAVTSVHSAEDVAGWDATIDVSGADVRVRVTGVAAVTIDWRCAGSAKLSP